MNRSITSLLLPHSRKQSTSSLAASVPALPSAPASVRSPHEICKDLRTALEPIGSSYFNLGEEIEENAVIDCRVVSNRHRAIESLPKGGIVGEIGTQTGHFADHIFKTSQPRKLHLFDLSLELFDKNKLVEPIRSGVVEIHLGDSSTELAKFPAEHFDWLYIDGDHSYEGVKKDIAQATQKVKRNGVLVFNDYTVWSPLEVCNYGVLKAINELVNDGEWKFDYLALHPWGYHDVALRRRS